jgi:hypothetical protein
MSEVVLLPMDVAVGSVFVSVTVPLEGYGGDKVMTVVDAMTEVMTVTLVPCPSVVDDGLGT